jgi:cytochrome c-type biogenesis protein
VFDISFGGAALAGVLAFFSPCILPMVPFYLCYLAGISMQELRANGQLAQGAQRRLVVQAVFFAVGVTTIFALLGLGATALGQGFRAWQQELSYVAAGVITVFGLHFLGIIRVPLLLREIRADSRTDPSTWAGAYVMGLAFGFGWTACVGPVLAAILMMASMQETLVRGTALVLTFGISMTAPFVGAAIFAQPFLRWIAKHSQHLRHVENMMGALLILFAVLILTDTVSTLSNWLLEVFDWSATML